MSIYILLLRGINVGGHGSLPMKELVACLETLGCRDVKTYIQSGNAVLRSSKGSASLSKSLIAEIRKRRGFEPHVLFLELGEFEEMLEANPFPNAVSDPKALHFGFLVSKPPKPDLNRLAGLASKRERFKLIEKVFYLHAPDGVGKSKLAPATERALGVPMTDRNWRTVEMLRDMARALDE